MKRNHEIHVAPDGLVTIVGGKLTTSRHMAEQTIDTVGKLLGRRTRCRTKSAYLLGAAGYDPQAIVASGGPPRISANATAPRRASSATLPMRRRRCSRRSSKGCRTAKRKCSTRCVTNSRAASTTCFRGAPARG